MKRSITEAQLTEAVYRNYHGETLTSIAKDFGIGQSTLSAIKSRRSEDWDRIVHQIIATEVMRMVYSNPPILPVNPPHKNISRLLQLINDKRDDILTSLCETENCTPVEAKDLWQTLTPLFSN